MKLSRPHGLKAWITSTCPHPKGHGQVEVTTPAYPHMQLKIAFEYGYKYPPDWTAGYFPPVGGRHESARGECRGAIVPLWGTIYITIRASNAKNGCSPILTRFVVFLLHAPPCMYTCTTVHHKPPSPFMGYTVKNHVTHARTNRSYAHESTNHL